MAGSRWRTMARFFPTRDSGATIKSNRWASRATGPTYQQSFYAAVQPYFFPSVSSDGRLVFYRAPDPQSGLPQVFLSVPGGSARSQLTNDPAGIAETALSGGGHQAYAIRQTCGLLAIDIDSGQAQTLVAGGAPFVNKTTGAIVAGSLVTFTGTNLLTSNGQSRVSFGALQPPVISSAETSVTIQVPWEPDVNNPLTLSVADTDKSFRTGHHAAHSDRSTRARRSFELPSTPARMHLGSRNRTRLDYGHSIRRPGAGYCWGVSGQHSCSRISGNDDNRAFSELRIRPAVGRKFGTGNH
jgi:hypothetical protein